MLMAKRWIAFLWVVLVALPAVSAQEPQRNQAALATGAQDVLIIIQPQQVRFTASQPVDHLHLQVTNQSGEVVFDSGGASVRKLFWPLQDANGTPLKSGLYAYALTIKAANDKEARVRRGHFIVDRAQDRDGSDKLWVTSPNTSGIGAELTVARDENATVAGTTSTSQRSVGLSDDKPKRGGEGEDQSGAQSKESITAAAGTIGRIAKFTSANDLGDSVMTEQNGRIGIGTSTPSHRLAVVGGPAWTGDAWGGALELENAAAIAWRENTSNVKFGIGRTENGLFFFRTNSPLGTTMNGPIYDFKMDNVGNVGIGRLGISTDLSGAKLNLLTASSSYGLAHSDGVVTVGSYVSSVGGWLGTRSNHSLISSPTTAPPRRRSLPLAMSASAPRRQEQNSTWKEAAVRLRQPLRAIATALFSHSTAPSEARIANGR